ncbi:hypothetical protein EN745_28015 [Mesorhizobium sp. M4A.F.Ca.ET.022.05.2.1]|uniref:hypothetical protein n=1 Tax=Mesorhizobium sp. M4A.F.Ca.ET.022.05.2.1 TaxID=2496653 RepID=UPI000FCC6F8B|nr:hypothetical protein [Mesorhizobium sp. M4A.F.Ca.ET.022.05.2.1]RVC75230.1 hypothetical protein EN745_28015 [Mesorhizobium sp. M4A.F.Ca.ET.022.05.2.1]
MDPAVAAVMILLSCSPGQTSVCRPIDSPPDLYMSVQECRASLKERLARSPNGEIIGRCREIDLSITGSLPAGHAIVTVTRGVGNKTVTSYIVPRKTD